MKQIEIGSPYILVKYSNDEMMAWGDSEIDVGFPVTGNDMNKPDGVYAGWRWDGRTLHVWIDHLGVFPLYYYASDTEVCVSPSLLLVLAKGAPRNLDYAALSVFLRLGFFIGEDTPFGAIKALPPDGELMWTEGRTTLIGGLPSIAGEQLERDSAIDGYVTIFREAMERRRPHDCNYILPLSGGRDSRHILFELHRLGVSPTTCITADRYPPHNSQDLLIARQLAQEMGIPHARFLETEARFDREFETNLVLNMCSDEGAWIAGLFRYLNAENPVHYDGMGGDVLSDGLFLTVECVELFSVGRIEELAEKLLHQWVRDSYIGKFLSTKHKHAMPRELAIERLANELMKFADFPNPLSAFYFFNRTRREIALSSLAYFIDIPEFYCPYLDHSVTEYLLSLPAETFIDKTFHAETINRAFPEYAHIPFEDTSAPHPHDMRLYRHRLKYLLDFLSFIAFRRRKWGTAGSLLFGRTLLAHFNPRLTRDASRFLWATLFLLQLEDLDAEPEKMFKAGQFSIKQ